MTRSVGIMAYGTLDDRLRLEAVALVAGKSSSQWLIEAIRKAFEEIYGLREPRDLVLKGSSK